MNKMEEYLKNLDIKQRYMMFILIFGIIIYGSIQIIMPMINQEKFLHNKIKRLQKKVKHDSLSNIQKELKSKKKKLLVLKTKVNDLEEKLNYLLSGVHKLKYTFDNKDNWAKDINLILSDSIKRNITINYIRNKNISDKKHKNILRKLKSIEISGIGNYVDIIAFISYIDNLKSLLRFTRVDINLVNEKVKFKIDIDMYGIKI